MTGFRISCILSLCFLWIELRNFVRIKKCTRWKFCDNMATPPSPSNFLWVTCPNSSKLFPNDLSDDHWGRSSLILLNGSYWGPPPDLWKDWLSRIGEPSLSRCPFVKRACVQLSASPTPALVNAGLVRAASVCLLRCGGRWLCRAPGKERRPAGGGQTCFRKGCMWNWGSEIAPAHPHPGDRPLLQPWGWALHCPHRGLLHSGPLAGTR